MGALAIVIGISALSSLLADYLRFPAFIIAIIMGAVLTNLNSMPIIDLQIINTIALVVVMFMAGTEFELHKFKALPGTKKVFVGTLLGVVAGFGILFKAAQLPLSEALGVSVLLGASSTLLILNILHHQHGFASWLAKITLITTLFQDGLLGFVFPWTLHDGRGSLWGVVTLCLLLGVLWRHKNTFERLGTQSPTTALFAGLSLAVLGGYALDFIGIPVGLWCFFLGIIFAGLSVRIDMQSRLMILQEFLLIILFAGFGLQMTASPDWTLFGWGLVVILAQRAIGFAMVPGSVREKTLYTANTFSVSELALLVIPAITLWKNWGQTLPWLFLTAAILSALGMQYLPNLLRYSSRKARPFKDGVASPPPESVHWVMWGLGEFGKEFLKLRQPHESVLVVDGSPRALLPWRTVPKIRQVLGDARNVSIIPEASVGQDTAIIVGLTEKELRGGSLGDLVTQIHKRFPNNDLIAIADTAEDAKSFYQKGCAYVLFRPLVQAKYFREIWLAREHQLLPEIKQKAIKYLDQY